MPKIGIREKNLKSVTNMLSVFFCRFSTVVYKDIQISLECFR